MRRSFKTTPYRRGYNFERRVKAHIEKMGIYVIRQGRSRFPDLICIGNGEAFFVECKVDGYLSKQERSRAQEIVKKTGCRFYVAGRVERRIVFTVFPCK